MSFGVPLAVWNGMGHAGPYQILGQRDPGGSPGAPGHIGLLAKKAPEILDEVYIATKNHI